MWPRMFLFLEPQQSHGEGTAEEVLVLSTRVRISLIVLFERMKNKTRILKSR